MHDRYVAAMLSSIETRISKMERREWSGGSEIDNRLLRRVLNQLEAIMATLQETLDRVTASGDRLDSLIEYNKGIKERLDVALSGVLTPAQQAQVDAIFKEADENVAKTDVALNANVEPAPVP